jgi:hypothetical protein
MSIAELFSKFVGLSEPQLPTCVFDIENEEIAEEIEFENEEVDAVNDHLSKVIDGQEGKLDLPNNILAQFEVIQDLSLDAWAAGTLRAYRG